MSSRMKIKCTCNHFRNRDIRNKVGHVKDSLSNGYYMVKFKNRRTKTILHKRQFMKVENE